MEPALECRQVHSGKRPRGSLPAGVNGHVEVRVRDNGNGIPPEFLPVIFDRFRQADSSASRTHGGLGIGLALVRQLVELHGGKADAESEGPGKGATFIIQLPIAGVPEDGERPHVRMPARTSPADSPWALHLRGIKVLVVDDEPDSLSMVRRILEENNAEVLTAASSDGAVGVLGSNTVDVIVSDIGMPVRDG